MYCAFYETCVKILSLLITFLPAMDIHYVTGVALDVGMQPTKQRHPQKSANQAAVERRRFTRKTTKTV